MTHRIFRPIWGLLLCSLASFGTPSPVPHGTVELISESRSIQPGTPLTVGLHFQLEPGWHIYWKNPGDSGLPPRIRWDVPAGFSAGPIEWPTPKRLPVGPLLDYGYERDVLLPVTLKVDPSVKPEPVDLKANLRVLVCRETCIPGKADLSLQLPVSSAPAKPATQYASLFKQARAARPLEAPKDWKVTTANNAGGLVLAVAGLKTNDPVAFFPATAGAIENAAPQQVTATGSETKIALKRALQTAASAPSELEGLLVISPPGGEAKAYEVRTRLPAVAAKTAAVPASNVSGGTTLATTVLFAFLGGLVLNLMPCVFPVLSLKALHLLESAGRRHRFVQFSALVYTAGVLVSFWALVAVLLALRSGGKHLGWGFQLQSPPFVAFLCCLLFILGLSLAGLFEIGQSLMSAGSGLAQREGYSGSFFTGVLATVVATPCTAPFMGAAVGFALSQSALICTVVFTSMALGLASPFLLLAIAPGLGRFLPRPGRWMETLKQLMAFPIFATVIWLMWVFGQQTDMNAIAGLLSSLLVISIGGWIVSRWAGNRLASAIAGLLIIGAIAFPALTASSSRNVSAAQRSSSRSGLPWEPFTKEKLASYRSSGKPVLIDFTAAWCLTCQVNDRVVFQSNDVKKRLSDGKIALLRADWTSYDPAITETLASFGRSGVPLYVIYGGQQQEPIVLPDGVLRPSTLLTALDNAKL